MKKIIFKSISILLAVISICSVTGCGNRGNNESSSPINSSTGNKIETTELSLAKNGVTEYKVVVDDEMTSNERFAMEELTSFLTEATGATFPVVTDEEVTYADTSKFLVVGDNKVSRTLDAVPTLAEVGTEGYKIDNYGNSLVISGASKVSFGTLYGVYEYLFYQIDLEIYAEDEVVYTQCDDVNLIKLSLTDRPDIENSQLSSGVYGNDLTFRRRMRMSDVWEVYAKFITPYHNSFTYIPKSNKDAHPKCFAADGSQLCYTAGDDEAEYEWMQEKILTQMIAGVMRESSDVVNVTLTIEDTPKMCTCSSCEKAKNLYNSATGAIVKFCNLLSEKMNAYLAKNNISKVVNIGFFAYLGTEAPPVTVENGVYTPTIYCNDNVFPILCTYNGAFEKPFEDTNANPTAYYMINGWGAVAKQISYWTYSTNFLNYTVPYDPFTCMQQDYKFLASTNPLTLLDQGQTGHADYATGFTMFKYYLQSKLRWNTDADVEELTKNYFKYYFGVACEEMYQYYTTYRLYLKYLTDEMDYHTQIFNALHTKYFPIGTLNSWNDMINKALKKIEPLKNTDQKTFAKLQKRIFAEKVMVEYLTLKLYGPMLSSLEYETRKAEYYEMCSIAGVTLVAEGQTMENVFN